MIIKFSTKADLEKLISIRLEMLRIVNDLNENYEFSSDFKKEVSDYFINGNQDTVIAIDEENENKIIGCATLSYIYIMPTFSHPSGKRGHLMNVYTNENYRRQGIAQKMINMLLEEAKKRKLTEISLDATEMGKPLYEKIGFIKNDSGMIFNL